MKFFRSLFLMGAFFLLGGCSSADVSDQKQEILMTPCKDPRPQMCTMDYNPVCGISKDDSKKSYSNGCSACSDSEVVEYYLGTCTK